jgi:nucleoside-diphosphate-sugar epimerase
MLKKKKIVVHGDGSSVWTLTHNTDFAQGFVVLIGKKETIGETYHITSDELLTWDQICKTMADAFGVKPKIVHIPSEFIRSIDKEWGDGLVGDKTHSAIFDNTKIKKLNPSYEAKVPFKQGAKEIADWCLKNKGSLKADPALDKRIDEMIQKYEKFLNG